MSLKKIYAPGWGTKNKRQKKKPSRKTAPVYHNLRLYQYAAPEAGRPLRLDLDLTGGSVLRTSLQAGPFRQLRRPLHDVVLELIVRDLHLAAFDPSAYGDAGLMHGVGIA